jgi:hypothetical protein
VSVAQSAGLVVVSTGTKGDTGGSKDPWARFCVGGEIASAAADGRGRLGRTEAEICYCD